MPNLDRRVDAARIEVLATRHLPVVPRALPQQAGSDVAPLGILPDWVDAVEIETTWRTDVAQASRSNESERTALADRPVRILTATLTGTSNTETHILAQALMAYADLGGPAPIFCDQAVVVSTNVEPDGLRVFCDAIFKRFFIGQRVAIVSGSPPVKESDDYFQWSTVLEVDGESILIESPNTPPLTGHLVFPCIDAQWVPDSSGTFITDEVLKVRMTWEEYVGPESLPATYPPLNFDNMTGLVGYVDGVPILDFPPNWSNGINVSVSRRTKRSPAGVGSIVAPAGKPFHAFELPFLADTREVMWSILRTFDALRGRTYGFYFLNPSDPWAVWSVPHVGSDDVQIAAVGSHEEIFNHFNHVLLTMDDGSQHVRELIDVNDNGDYFILTLDSNRPAGTATAIRPLHLCHLSSDSLKETWSTDGVATVSLSVQEDRTFDEVETPTDESLLTLLHFQIPTEILQANPDVWFDANTNCFAFSTDNSRLLRARPWPLSPSRVKKIFDPREALGDDLPSNQITDFPNLVPTDIAATQTFGVNSLPPPSETFCAMLRYEDHWANNGAHTLFGADLKISDSHIDEGRRHLWTDDGWTLIIGFTRMDRHYGRVAYSSSLNPVFGGPNHPFSPSGSQLAFSTPDNTWLSYLFSILEVGSGDELFSFVGGFDPHPESRSTVGAYSTAKPMQNAGIYYRDDLDVIHHVSINGLYIGNNHSRIVVINWNKALNRLYVHSDDRNLITNPPVGYETVSSIKQAAAAAYDSQFGMQMLGGPQFVGSADFPQGLRTINRLASEGAGKYIGTNGGMNFLLSWQKSLADTEVNAVAREMSDTYGTGWNDLAY